MRNLASSAAENRSRLNGRFLRHLAAPGRVGNGGYCRFAAPAMPKGNSQQTALYVGQSKRSAGFPVTG